MPNTGGKEATNETVDLFAQKLGGFCWNFSIIEAQMRSALYRSAGVTPTIGNAVFSGVRVEGAIQLIGRIADAANWPTEIRNELKYIFDQMSLINKFRNDILHYGAYKLGDDYIISNRPTARIPEKIRELRISDQTLDAVNEDIVQIIHRLQLIYFDLPEETETAMRTALKPSWRYKEPPPAWGNNKTPGTPPKQRRRQKPSQA